MTLQSLRHPNVLQFLGCCMKPPNLAMVTEHLPFSLHSVLYGGNTTLDKARWVRVWLWLWTGWLAWFVMKGCDP